MKRWTIGNIRRQRADIRLNDETVSGLHASLTQTDSGRWMLEDQNSLNGTFRASNGHWIQIRQSEVGIDDHLRFGRAETTVRQLLKLSPPPASPPASPSGEQDVVSWWSDLAIGLSKITNFAEFRKNVMFVFDLISSPGER